VGIFSERRLQDRARHGAAATPAPVAAAPRRRPAPHSARVR